MGQMSERKLERTPTPYVSLFSGAMGLDLGLEQQGFFPLACNDSDPIAVATIKKNKPRLPVLEQDVQQIDRSTLESACGSDLKELPLVAGGPPCQAFSVFGHRRGLNDPRGRVLFDFVRIIDELRPKTFLMENVRGLHSMPLIPPKMSIGVEGVDDVDRKRGSLLKTVLRDFEAIGYRVDCFLVNAVNYGAPQIRERLLCIGNRFNRTADFPGPQFSNRPEDGLPPFRTLGEAIGDGFVDPDRDIMNFSARKLAYLAMVPAGGNWRSLPEDVQRESMGKSWHLKGGRSAYWRKLSFAFPSPTVVTMPNHAGTSMCHPTELRALTVGELAAIQEFPLSWRFAGTPPDKCRQIGNAVPIRLGAVAGGALNRLLDVIDSSYAVGPEEDMPSSRVIHLRPHVRTRSFWRNGEALAGDHDYVVRAAGAVCQSQLPA